MVDDDEVDRLLFQRVLRASGIQADVTEVEDCAGAIAYLEASSFDCIFLDYRLPDGDGLELILQIRQLGTTLPIVVLTGQGDERIAVELMKSGASDYLVKSSLTPENLGQTLRSVTRIYQAEAQVALTQARLRQSEERFRSLVQYSSDIITILEPDGTISYESPSIERILGYLPDELLGKRLQDFVHPAKGERQKAIDHTKHCIDLAVQLGIPSIRLNSGRWKTIKSFDELMKVKGQWILRQLKILFLNF